MRRTTVFTASLATALLCPSATLIAQSPRPEAVELVGQIPRVRSENPDIAEQIADATRQSPFFRALVAEIDASNGIVYVVAGQCRHGGAACFMMRVTKAASNRILQIRVDPRFADCDVDLIASIGHELWHVLEILRNPKLDNDDAIFHFYAREGRHSNRATFPFGGWETTGALEAGYQVLRELRAAGIASRGCKGARR